MTRTGLSNTEVAVVLAVLFVLVILILPAIQQAREAARGSTCKNNLKQLGLGYHNYHDVYEGFPVGCLFNEEIDPQVFSALCTIAGKEEVPAEW